MVISLPRTQARSHDNDWATPGWASHCCSRPDSRRDAAGIRTRPGPSPYEDIKSALEDDAISRRTGRAVKQQREGLGLSLRMLAARSGISSSMITDIERGTKSPTVVTVVRLAQALRGAAAALIDGGPEATRIRILRRDEGAGGEHPVRWKSLSATRDSRIDIMRFEIPPATSLGPAAAHAPGTVEHMHVAAGTVRVTVGDETADLAAGDSCSCRTDVPHEVANPDPSAEALVYLIGERG